MGDGESFIDGDGVGNSISGVADDTGGSSSRVEGKNGLYGNVKAGNIEGLEHDLGHLLSVSLWVKWGFGEEHWVFIWGHSELNVEAVVPDLLHIIPVFHDTVFNWVGDLEDSSLLLSLISEIFVFGLDSNEGGGILGSSHN